VTQRRWLLAITGALVLVCGVMLLAALFGPGVYRLVATPRKPTPDFDATLQYLLTQVPEASPTTKSTSASPTSPAGRIVLTCQLFKSQATEQICLMNADGSDYHRLTTEDGIRHFYPSLAPDGRSVVYSQYRADNVYEIYELSIGDDSARRLTDRLGVLTAPEISPDGTEIAFMRWTPASDQNQVWLMDRDGNNAHAVVAGSGWDPTWSPDGTWILFASDRDGPVELYKVHPDGSEILRVSDLPAIRGRSDWSTSGLIATYSGEAWHREVFVMRPDGSETRQISPPGGNSQGPSFSPDGAWIAFTAYFDAYREIHGCEIYVIRSDGADLRRLTENDYCDYQPRWGP
jgi:TolB protein